MANSVNPECNSYKRRYDSCFNTWFEQYLNLASPATPTSTAVDPEALRKKGAELNTKCGDLFKIYRTCIEVSVSPID